MARPRTRRAAKESQEKAEKAVEQPEQPEQQPDQQENGNAEEAPLEETVAEPLLNEDKSAGKRRRSDEASPVPAREEKRQRVS